MSDYPETPTTPGGRSHKSRPSLVTNASGFAESTMSCGSMTTADGLSRLSHFPLPPIGVPLSPFEAQLDWPTPVRRTSEMTPPDTPKADPILPHSGSSIISPSGMTGPSLLPMSPPVTPPIRPRRNLPTPPPSVGSPISVRPLVIGSTFVSDSSQISPHDWHDGSSSLAMNGYEERLLPTNLITSLLSTVTPEDDITPDQPPPRYKRDPYEPSVVSGIANRDSIYPPSSIVALQSPPYTPRHDYPPPHLRNISVSDASSAKSSTILSGPVGSSSMVPVIPTQDGRVTPESSRTYGSEVTELSRTAVRTAAYAPAVSRDAAVVGVAHATTRSVAPSLGSMNSTTPLMQSVPRGDVIHEDTIGEQLGAAGPSTPTTAHRESQRFRETRSIRSTKTSKSYVPSLVTRFSHSTVGERRSFKQAVTWFRKKPLPPVPRLPDFSVHQEIEHRRAEATLPLPDLVHRAQALSQMLDKGDPPHHSPIEGNNKFEELYLPSGSAPSSPPNFSANHPGLMSRARKAYSQDYRDGEWNQVPPAVPNKPRKFLVTRRQKICCGGIVLAIVIIVIAVAVGVSVGKKHSSSSSCAANLAGAKCDLGM